MVQKQHLDAGFAFDGDADRCLAVDEGGNVITGDHILYIFATDLGRRGMLAGDTVVTTVMSNFGLYKALDELGIKYEKTAVGDKYVYECMTQNGYRLGGEQSGHVIFSKVANTGDGLITAIKMMELICNSDKTLHELTEGYVIYPQVLENVRVVDKKKAMEDPAVLKAITAAEEDLAGMGRVLVRASGTEPVVRVMAEAESIEMCRKCVFDIIAVMKRRGLLQ